MAVARGVLPAFCIKLIDSNGAGGYGHSSCSLQSSKSADVGNLCQSNWPLNQ